MIDLLRRGRQIGEALMRDGICEAATAVLVDVGLTGLTMDRVADAAGVSKGTLYNYFRDKDALVLEVVDRAFTPVQDELDRIAAQEPNARMALLAATRTLFLGIEKRRGLAAVLKEGELTEVVRAEISRRMTRTEDLFGKILADAGLAGMLPPTLTSAPREAGRLYFLSLHGIIDRHIGYPEDCPPLSEQLASVESLLVPLWCKETP